MRTLPAFLIGISLLSSLNSCENCGPTAEPRLLLSLNDSVSGVLDTLYAPNSKGQLPPQPYGNNSPFRTGSQITLPINLNADSTQYVFKLRGSQDTVTVYYRRDFSFRNRKCGYVIDLFEPRSGPNARASRGRVSNVYYGQNKNSNFLNPSQDTNIGITVQL